jgi:hypothetical protein
MTNAEGFQKRLSAKPQKRNEFRSVPKERAENENLFGARLFAARLDLCGGNKKALAAERLLFLITREAARARISE